ncbi:MAG: hypothetical protein ACYC1I_09860 [Acidimicrobiales bacterium]
MCHPIGLTRLTDSLRVIFQKRHERPATTLGELQLILVDGRGHVTLRYLGTLRHLNIGWSYQDCVIKLYVLDDVVAFASEDGEFVGETRIDPDRDYQLKGTSFER